VPGERFYVNLLPRWLTNDTFRLRQRPLELAAGTFSVTVFLPGKGAAASE
jgi:hypothetical protein